MEHVRHTFFCRADDVFLLSRWHFWKKCRAVEILADAFRAVDPDSFFSLQYFNKFFVQLRFVSYSRNMFMLSVVKRKIPLKNLSFWAINISPLKFAKQQLIIILRNRKKVHFISTLTFLSPNYRCQRFHFFTLLPSNFSAEIVLLFLLKYRCWLLTH